MNADHRGIRLCALLLFLLPLAGCGGGDTQGDDASMLRWGGDVLGGGEDVRIAEDVAGDVMVGGDQLAITGVVGGDYLGAGRTLEIDGRISGDVRAGGRTVRIGGDVARNVTAAGQQVVVAEDATIGRNAYLAGQLVQVDGAIGGFLRATAQDIVLNGTVEGSVDVRGGSLRIGPEARITGDLTYRVPAASVRIDPAARIGGTRTMLPVEEKRARPPVAMFRGLTALAFLLTGVVLVAVFARTAAAAEAALRRRPGASLGLGLAWVILVPIGIAILALSVLGIPLALIVLAVYLFSLYIGRVVVALWLGRLLLRRWARPERGRLVVAYLLGGILLLLLCLIPVLGKIILIVATLLGLGSLALAARERAGGAAAPGGEAEVVG